MNRGSDWICDIRNMMRPIVPAALAAREAP